MRIFFVLAILLLCLGAAPAAVPGPRAGPPPLRKDAKKSSKYEQDLKTLQQAYYKATDAFVKTLSALPEEEQLKTYRNPSKNPTRVYVEKARALAARAKATPTEFKAKVFALQVAWNCGALDARDRIADDLIAKHMKSPDFRDIIYSLGDSQSSAAEKAMGLKRLRLIEEKSPHAPVRANAIRGQIELAYDTYNGTGDMQTARLLAQKLARQYGKTRAYRSTYGDYVKGLLFQMDNLGVGKVAPDIEGEDQDGVRFKLSDYRGKVVVLDFWGFW